MRNCELSFCWYNSTPLFVVVLYVKAYVRNSRLSLLHILLNIISFIVLHFGLWILSICTNNHPVNWCVLIHIYTMQIYIYVYLRCNAYWIFCRCCIKWCWIQKYISLVFLWSLLENSLLDEEENLCVFFISLKCFHLYFSLFVSSSFFHQCGFYAMPWEISTSLQFLLYFFYYYFFVNKKHILTFYLQSDMIKMSLQQEKNIILKNRTIWVFTLFVVVAS